KRAVAMREAWAQHLTGLPEARNKRLSNHIDLFKSVKTSIQKIIKPVDQSRPATKPVQDRRKSGKAVLVRKPVDAGSFLPQGFRQSMQAGHLPTGTARLADDH